MNALKKTFRILNFSSSSYQWRIFIYFFSTFLFFAIAILSFQYRREKGYRVHQLETKLDNTAAITNAYMKNYNILSSGKFNHLDSLVEFLPDRDIRITVISGRGKVLYDSFVPDYEKMENHLMRAEIQKALYSGTGGNKRHSSTTGQDFYYYARHYDDYFIRCAAVYNVEIQNFLKTESFFIFFTIAIFIVMGSLLYLVTNQLGTIINRLRDFAIRAGKQETIDSSYEFADSEFGEIQKQIIQIYDNLKNAKEEITSEKERLYNHLDALNEGIAFYTADKKKILTNNIFIQHINEISNMSGISADDFFNIKAFNKLCGEIDDVLETKQPISSKNLPHIEKVISRKEKYYKVRAIIFADRSFEILISDITKPEKRRLIKQQLTSNIAHELKTPLASIKGYLETIIHNDDIEKEKMVYFARRALVQGDRLNNLLNDVSLLNNIEQGGTLFEFGIIRIKTIIQDVVENLESQMNRNGSKVYITVDPSVKVLGNESLISSIFQNLIENSLNYAGEGVQIDISHYLEDEKYHYFSVSDDGIGISEEHISRVFERFYRADEGRSREHGGTGLGLAIVKNAVQLHKGDISVKNRSDKGLEFFFSLAKY